MSSSAVLGQYLWHELVTTDPDAGAPFYSKVVGWSRLPYEGNADYIMLGNDKGPVGGARVVGKDPLADAVGPNWLTYVGVPDIAAALATVAAKGGRVVHPVTEIPGNGGSYAVIADPEGSTIGIYQPGGGMSADSAGPTAQPVVWHELTANNAETALSFYKDLFGWEVLSTVPMGGEVGNYFLFGIGKTQMGGVFNRPKNLPPTWPRWLVYLGVPGVLAAVEAVKAAGGQIVNGPHQVPGGGWMAQVTDSHGVPMAVHGPKEAAPAAKPKAKAAAKPKSAAKPKVKAKAKPKPKAKSKSKAKAKSAPAKAKTNTKAKNKRKVAVKARKKAKTKVKAKAKRKPKTKVKSKARKGARRHK
jgi:uncharacterized protein